MTAMSNPQVCAVPRRTGHFGIWRALTAIPAMVGSVLLLVVLFGWLGEWEGAVLLGWFGSGVVLCSRFGERLSVGVGAGFRRPTGTESARLAPAWAAALDRCGVTEGEVDIYVRRGQDLNAFSAGGRSVAITTGVLARFSAHRRGEEYLVAILTHELGHRATRATKFTLVTAWLAFPWRFASRLVIGIIISTIGRRKPLLLPAGAVVASLMIAIVQAVQHRQWAVATVLTAIAMCSVACPLIDAAVSRRSEFAADRYAAAAGLGPQLAAALKAFDGGQRRPRLVARLLSSHPTVARRIAGLSGVPESV